MLSPVVLISDDEPLVVSALSREARRSGLSSVADTTSHHVLELARKYRPAVIILDIHQNQDGRDLLARLKQDPETRECKVIILSGVEDQFTRHVCFELGADAYEVKPFDHTFMTRVARMAGVKVAVGA
ncbi:response regulator [Archangium violaceum]|uniref:response regulator n=1 Tax=Archangium violaceum TaxID=83451 RepID=UPI00193BD815|nr:response regulator [Archangium violaceum]QRK09349.1 response regulator [Archangium violaceum]